MKKAIGILFLCATVQLQAQYVRPNDSPLPPPSGPPTTSQVQSNGWDNISLGGAFALQFASYSTFIELEPLMSYHFGPSFMIGLGPIYQYESVNDIAYGYYSYSYTTSIYGGRVAALYFLPDEFSKVFIMGEYDVLNVPEFGQYTYQIGRGYITLPMLGIGYKERISDKAFLCIYGLWNFSNSPYNPFSNPIINLGVDIGLWH